MQKNKANPAYDLLIQSIRLDDPQRVLADAVRIIQSTAMDWHDLIALAGSHEIIPMLHHLFKRMPDQVLPDWVLNELQEAHRQIAREQLAMVAEFQLVRRQLTAAGVDAIPFKGFWLGYASYGNLANRECVDIDLFIRKEDFNVVREVMTGLGYTPLPGLGELDEDQLFRKHGDYSFDKMQGETRVFHFEFHWSLGNYKYVLDIGMPNLTDQVEEAPFSGGPLKVFSPSANLLLASLHHGAKDAWLKLKQVQDIGQLIHIQGNTLDWPWIMAESERLKASGVVLAGVGLAVELCGVSAPDPVAAPVSSVRVQRLVHDRLYYLSQPLSFWKRGYYLNKFRFHWQSRNGSLVRWKTAYAFFTGSLVQKTRQWKTLFQRNKPID